LFYENLSKECLKVIDNCLLVRRLIKGNEMDAAAKNTRSA